MLVDVVDGDHVGDGVAAPVAPQDGNGHRPAVHDPRPDRAHGGGRRHLPGVGGPGGHAVDEDRLAVDEDRLAPWSLDPGPGGGAPVGDVQGGVPQLLRAGGLQVLEGLRGQGGRGVGRAAEEHEGGHGAAEGHNRVAEAGPRGHRALHLPQGAAVHGVQGHQGVGLGQDQGAPPGQPPRRVLGAQGVEPAGTLGQGGGPPQGGALHPRQGGAVADQPHPAVQGQGQAQEPAGHVDAGRPHRYGAVKREPRHGRPSDAQGPVRAHGQGRGGGGGGAQAHGRR